MNLLPFHLMVDKVWHQAALRLIPNTHPLHKAVNQAVQHFMNKHHSPLHELMFKYKLKPKLLEKISAIRQDPKWELGVAIRIAEDKKKAQEEDNREKAVINVYMDGSRIEGQIGATAVLYCDGVLKRKMRMRLGSEKHHTVFEEEGIGLILGMELIREEEVADRMVSIGIDNVAAISTSHYIWDIFHQRVNMVYNKHKGLDFHHHRASALKGSLCWSWSLIIGYSLVWWCP